MRICKYIFNVSTVLNLIICFGIPTLLTVVIANNISFFNNNQGGIDILWIVLFFTLVFLMLKCTNDKVSLNKTEKIENRDAQYGDISTADIIRYYSNNISNRNILKQKTPVPSPEDFFFTPRIIDWKSINEKKLLHGQKGEAIVVDIEINYLNSIGKKSLANKVVHVSQDGDGYGYDILSYFPDGREKYIEVKSTTQNSSSSFIITSNEYRFLKENKDRAFVYHVNNISADGDWKIQSYSADMVLSGDLTATQYKVKI